LVAHSAYCPAGRGKRRIYDYDDASFRRISGDDGDKPTETIRLTDE